MKEIYTDLKSQLPALIEAIRQGAEWGKELAYKWTYYDLTIRLIYLIILFSIVLFYILKIKKWWDAYNKDWNINEDDYHFLLVVMGIFLAVVIAFVIPINIEYVLKDIFVPEIRILEMLQSLT